MFLLIYCVINKYYLQFIMFITFMCKVYYIYLYFLYRIIVNFGNYFDFEFSNKNHKFMRILRIMPPFYVYVNQGFHISMDSLDGFSGLASKTLEYLQDEYANKNIFAMPVMSENYITGDEYSELHAVNMSLLFSSLFEHSNIFVPLTTSSGGWVKSHNHLSMDHLSYKVY